MERYQNINGDSGIYAYEIESDTITVEFTDGTVYLYIYQSAGKTNIEKMKKLALAGQGLNQFINTTVDKAYARNIR